MSKRNANSIGHILRTNCLLHQVIEGKIKGGIEVPGRRGRRRRKLLDDLRERTGYSHLKEEALDRTMWRARFGPVVRQTTKWMNEPELMLFTQFPYSLSVWFPQYIAIILVLAIEILRTYFNWFFITPNDWRITRFYRDIAWNVYGRTGKSRAKPVSGCRPRGHWDRPYMNFTFFK
jgi:hypothetical protein